MRWRTLLSLGLGLALTQQASAQIRYPGQASYTAHPDGTVSPGEIGPQPRVLPSAEPSVIDQGNGPIVESPMGESYGLDLLGSGYEGGGFDWNHDGEHCGGAFAWVSADYFLGWIRDARTPPLVTASPGNINPADAGVLGLPTTTTLLGGEWSQGAFSGMRITAGMMLPNMDGIGVELSGFFTEGRTSIFDASGNGTAGSPFIGRPYVIAGTDIENFAPNSSPVFNGGSYRGDITVDLHTRLWGIEGNVLSTGTTIASFMPTFFLGYRYIDFEETIDINERINPTGGFGIAFGGNVLTAPNGVAISDSFHAHNHFHGANLGAKVQQSFGNVDVGVVFKLGLGVTHQTLTIAGQSTALDGNGAAIAALPGGLLATSTNIGRFSRDPFTVVPEIELKLGYRLTENLSAFVSYDFLYWSNVLRAGDQIDRNVNLTNVPTSPLYGFGAGPAQPAPLLDSTDFWMHSFRLGVALTF